MRKIFRIITMLFICCIFALTIFAKETVLIDNDFSKTDLSGFQLKGNWQVSGGELSTAEGSGSAYLVYEIPDHYKGKSFQVDVDFVGHTSTGGILIGATGNGFTGTPSGFWGFDGFIGPNGDLAALGCYNATGGWGGNIQVSDPMLMVADLHLTARVVGNNLTYLVTSLDGETQYFGISYDLGTGTQNANAYTAFDGKIGLRKFYTDRGAFDNFKLTVFEDDVLPTLNRSLQLGEVGFRSSGIRKSGETVSGSGAMLTEKLLPADFKAEVLLKPEGVSKLLFGMTDSKNGYAFEINKPRETVALYQIKDGAYIWLASKKMPVGDGPYLTSVSVHEKIATVVFDAFSQGEGAFPTFELNLAGYAAGRFGVWLEGGTVSSLAVTDSVGKDGETYRNPVNTGADPALLFHDGTYYLYHRITSGNNIFRVYTSPNLVDWLARDVVFAHKPDEYSALITGYMSPIPFYYDGIFYLFFSANIGGESRILYATSDSPYGPFEYKNGEKPLHSVAEIYGYPFLDDDGKLYMIVNRFGNGNHVCIEEIRLQDGVFSTVPGTLTRLMSPTTEYENDGYGFVSEGGAILKHDGYYYLVWSTGHFKGHYGLAYAVSENVRGPYTRYEYNDILTYNSVVDGVGYGVFVPSPDGTELYVLYHKHLLVGQVSPRQTCLDKVQFVKNPNGGPDILTINGPSTTPQVLPSNIYRYDVNRDGTESLADIIAVAKHVATFEKNYVGTYDVNANHVVDFYDVKAMHERLGTSAVVELTIGSTIAYIDGEAKILDAAPINRNNRTMLPVRFLANALGIDNDGIKWDAATRTATLSNNEVTIVVTIDAPTMTVNGETVALDSPAIIAYDRTYLPVRAIANALGVSNENIAWDAETSTATLVK